MNKQKLGHFNIFNPPNASGGLSIHFFSLAELNNLSFERLQS